MAVTKAKKRMPSAAVYDAISTDSFPNVATLGAGVASTAIQARFVMPITGKILLVTAGFSAIGTPQATHLFNMVFGNGAYQTGTTGVAATATVTIAGTITTGNVVQIQVAGNTFQYVVQSTDTTATILAASICKAFNSGYNYYGSNSGTQYFTNGFGSMNAQQAAFAGIPVNKLVQMNNNAGVITIGALQTGTAANAITLAASVIGTGTTATASAATLSSGANSTGITPLVTDSENTNGVYNMNLPVAGQALFSSDQALTGVGDGYAASYQPSVWDAIIPLGTLITLRVSTPASTGSLTNFNVGFTLKPYDLIPVKPGGTANNFSPLLSMF